MTSHRPSAFTEREFLTLTGYLDALLPESSLGPSASAAGVPAYIESLCRPPERTGWRWFRGNRDESRAAMRAFYRRLIFRLDEIADDEFGRAFFQLSRSEQGHLVAEFANTSERDTLSDDASRLLPEELADSDLYRLSRVYAIQGYFALPRPESLRSLRASRAGSGAIATDGPKPKVASATR